jgi:hypothetical protein
MFMDMKLRSLWKAYEFPSQNLAQCRQVWNRIQVDLTGVIILAGLRADAGVSLFATSQEMGMMTDNAMCASPTTQFRDPHRTVQARKMLELNGTSYPEWFLHVSALQQHECGIGRCRRALMYHPAQTKDTVEW